jgi:hypothetical protein
MQVGGQAEFREDILVCSDCRVALVAEPETFLTRDQVRELSREVEAATGETAEESLERRSRMDVATGAFCVLVGIAGTAATYVMALPGGVYMVAWGPMVFGIMRLMRGLERSPS